MNASTTSRPDNIGKIAVCAAVLSFGLIAFLLLSHAENLKYRIIFVAVQCLLSAVAVAIWTFVSKKKWSWLRVALTISAFYFAITYINVLGRTQHHAEALKQMPKLSFSPSIAPRWTVQRDEPLKDDKGIFGHVVLLVDSERGRVISMQLDVPPDSEMALGFKNFAESWTKELAQEFAGQFQGQVDGDQFFIEENSGTPMAQRHYHIKNNTLTMNVVSKLWMHGSTAVSFTALGKDLDVAGDKDIQEVFSSVRLNP